MALSAHTWKRVCVAEKLQAGWELFAFYCQIKINMKTPLKYGGYVYLLITKLILVFLFFIFFTWVFIGTGDISLFWLPLVCLLLLVWLWFRGGGRDLFKKKNDNN